MDKLKKEATEFVKYLRGRLIPDLKKSGSEFTAEDFEKACVFITRLSNRVKDEKVKPDFPVIIRAEDVIQVCAFFPTEPGTNDPRTMGCYSLREGHSTAVAGYIGRKTKPATSAQITTMLKELDRIGYTKDYNLRVVSRVSSHHTRERREACREIKRLSSGK